MGYSEHVLLDVLEEIQGLPFSSLGVEQTHSSASRVLKHHPEIEGSYLASRALLDQIRALVTPHDHDIKMRRLQGQIDRLSSTRQRAIRVRELYLQRCFEVARGLHNNRPLPRNAREQLMRNHVVEYQSLSEEQKDALQFEADPFTG